MVRASGILPEGLGSIPQSGHFSVVQQKTPYEMLYGKKPNLKNLHEWGSDVWVHTTEGTKLDSCSKVGKWVGFDEISNGHQIYWPDKCSVTIEHSVKFANGDIVRGCSIASESTET